MSYNPSECQVITITTKKNQPSDDNFIHGLKLESTTSAKNLGTNISANLTCNHRDHSTANKSNRALGFLRRNTYTCPLGLNVAKPSAAQFLNNNMHQSCGIPKQRTCMTNQLEVVGRRAARYAPIQFATKNI